MSDRQSPPAWVVMIVMLALSAGMMLVPRRVSVALRGGLGAALEPGQQTAAFVVQHTESGIGALATARSAVREVKVLRQEVRRLESERRRIEQQLQTAIDERPLQLAGRWTEPRPGEPLLVPRIQVAHVLGEDAVAFLAKHRLLSLGSHDDLQSRALVLEGGEGVMANITVDQGWRAGVEDGSPVLWGRAVLGRILEVSPHTSRVQLVRDGGFRAAARLARRSDQGLVWGASGVLEGTGGPLCRLAHVSATRPVEAGDLVVTADNEGILPHPLLYGRVEQCVLRPGGSYWEIWVRPAAAAPRWGKVLVLTPQLNPERVSAGRTGK